MLLGSVIILLPSGRKDTSAPISSQFPHLECQAPGGAGRCAYVKKIPKKQKKHNCSERMDSKRSFTSPVSLLLERGAKIAIDFSKKWTDSYLKVNLPLV